jgi:hypothetical protein
MRFSLPTLCLLFPATLVAAPDAVFVPTDAGHVNVKDHGAKGDGKADDTAAIVQAIRANLNDHRTIFFPAGTYLVSDELHWANAKGEYWPFTTWQGEGSGKSVIRLKDNCFGFGDPAKPKALVRTGCYDGNRTQNAAHNCYFFDLALHTGSGNPGAVALDYNAHNNGAVVRVRIESGDGKGVAGLELTRDPGPCLIRDVSIRGFDHGVRLGGLLFSVTFENLRLARQNVAGLTNNGNVAAIRRLTSNNAVPAVVMSGWAAMTILLDSELTGGAADRAAIENRDGVTLLARNVTVGGYGKAVRSVVDGKEKVVPAGKVDEILLGTGHTLGGGPARTLNLPVEETPEFHSADAADWVSVADFGAKPGGADVSAAVQKAVDSGKPVIYFPKGSYRLDKPVLVRGKVRRILGNSSSFAGAKGKVLFRFENADHAVSLERFNFFDGGRLVHAADKPVVLRYITGPERDGLRTEGEGRTWFFEDVCHSHFRLGKGQRLFARQWNCEPEPPGAGFVNDGGDVWVLGLKAEWGNTLGVTRGGGRTEVLGGLVLPAQGFKDSKAPTFVNDESSLSASWNEMTFGTPTFQTAVEETLGGATRLLTHRKAFGEGTQFAWSLYSGTPAKRE